MIKEQELSALRQRVRAIIKDELGLANFLEDDEGDFTFNYERFSYELIFDPNDPSFIWIRGASRFELPDPERLAKADACINQVNRMCKLVKLYRQKNQEGGQSVVASAALLVDNVAFLSADTIERAVFLIKLGKRDFYRLFEKPEAIEAPGPSDLFGRAEPVH